MCTLNNGTVVTRRGYANIYAHHKAQSVVSTVRKPIAVYSLTRIVTSSQPNRTPRDVVERAINTLDEYQKPINNIKAIGPLRVPAHGDGYAADCLQRKICRSSASKSTVTNLDFVVELVRIMLMLKK